MLLCKKRIFFMETSPYLEVIESINCSITSTLGKVKEVANTLFSAGHAKKSIEVYSLAINWWENDLINLFSRILENKQENQIKLECNRDTPIELDVETIENVFNILDSAINTLKQDIITYKSKNFMEIDEYLRSISINKDIPTCILLSLLIIRNNRSQAILHNVETNIFPKLRYCISDGSLCDNITDKTNMYASLIASDVVAYEILGPKQLKLSVDDTSETASLALKRCKEIIEKNLETNSGSVNDVDKLSSSKCKNIKECESDFKTSLLKLLGIYTKANYRLAKTYSLMASLEELQIFESLISKHIEKSSGDFSYVSFSTAESAARRYKCILKAWYICRDASVNLETYFDKIKKNKFISSLDISSILTQQRELLNKALLCQSLLTKYIQTVLSPNVMPFSSQIHGIGIMSSSDICEGTTLIYEPPIARTDLSDISGKNTSLLKLKDIIYSAHNELSYWWKKNCTHSLSNLNSIKNISLISKNTYVLDNICNSFIHDYLSNSKISTLPASFYKVAILLALRYDELLCSYPKNLISISQQDAILCSIWNCNAMSIDLPDYRILDPKNSIRNKNGVGLYATGSRINHNHIHPNAICIFDPYSGYLSVRSLVKISAGNEIYISYCPIISSFLERKRFLCFNFRQIVKKKRSKDGNSLEIIEDYPCFKKNEKCDDNGQLQEEAADDVMPPRLAGLEQIICPHCDSMINCRRESESITFVPCKVCNTDFPIAVYYERLFKIKKLANEKILGTSKDKTEALKMLLETENSSKLLHQHHFLRFQIRDDIFAASSLADLTPELTEKLVRLSREFAEREEEVSPPSWPFVTGHRMNFLYAVGRHRRLTDSMSDSDFFSTMDEFHKQNNNNIGFTINIEYPSWWADQTIPLNPYDVNIVILRYLHKSFHDHKIAYGNRDSVRTFFERFRYEFGGLGIQKSDQVSVI